MNEKIPIGELIRKQLEEENRSVAWLAKKVYCDRSSFWKILNRNYMDTELLLRISIILKVDFFAFYSKLLRTLKEKAV